MNRECDEDQGVTSSEGNASFRQGRTACGPHNEEGHRCTSCGSAASVVSPLGPEDGAEDIRAHFTDVGRAHKDHKDDKEFAYITLHLSEGWLTSHPHEVTTGGSEESGWH
ncbi:conserved hypothetical protein [Aspergillus udagawae]|uniref:Uncharacterized protein n=1 Tax=Aspergillus udagawae TaxID=91492 RepID=A0A8H3NHY3_9EURO|nr:conserved hypothetical protein [Aspergillus udagawae]